jgi:hypothetical protein
MILFASAAHSGRVVRLNPAEEMMTAMVIIETRTVLRGIQYQKSGLSLSGISSIMF